MKRGFHQDALDDALYKKDEYIEDGYKKLDQMQELSIMRTVQAQKDKVAVELEKRNIYQNLKDKSEVIIEMTRFQHELVEKTGYKTEILTKKMREGRRQVGEAVEEMTTYTESHRGNNKKTFCMIFGFGGIIILMFMCWYLVSSDFSNPETPAAAPTPPIDK